MGYKRKERRVIHVEFPVEMIDEETYEKLTIIVTATHPRSHEFYALQDEKIGEIPDTTKGAGERELSMRREVLAALVTKLAGEVDPDDLGSDLAAWIRDRRNDDFVFAAYQRMLGAFVTPSTFRPLPAGRAGGGIDESKDAVAGGPFLQRVRGGESHDGARVPEAAGTAGVPAAV